MPALHTRLPSFAARRTLGLITALVALGLGACSSSDDEASTNAPSSNSGALVIAAANPAAHNSSVDLGTARNAGNSARVADVFSSVPYCEVFWEEAVASNGRKYAFQIYFRQGDKQAIHVSLMEASATAPTLVVFQNASGAPITGFTVDTAARTIVIANKTITGSAGQTATISGTISFGRNSTVAACGA